jgi:membrane protease YdiL (CAAX protease family)
VNWILAAAAPVLIGSALLATGRIHPAILAYHALCAAAIFRQRRRLRPLFPWNRTTALATLATTFVIVAFLLAAPFVRDPAPYRDLFRHTLFPRGDPRTLFTLFAAYTMVVHAPLEEVFWRGVVMDPDRRPSGTTVAGNAFFFYLNHAVPMALVLGPQGAVLAGPTAAAGALWAFVTIRSRSLWPGLVSHWAADAAILGGMWFYFIR